MIDAENTYIPPLSNNGDQRSMKTNFTAEWLSDKSERFNVAKFTHIVDFSKTPSFTDPEIADACVVVLTSNGQLGSLSHLRISHNPELFASDLRELLGEDNTPIILSGGLIRVRESKQLVDKLIEQLGKTGFLVSRSSQHSDLLKEYNRQATLYADHVMLRRRLYGDTTWEERILQFPKGINASNF